MAKISLSRVGISPSTLGGGQDSASTTLPTLGGLSAVGTGAGATSPSRRARISLKNIRNDPQFQEGFNPGEFLGKMVEDTVKGAVAPVTFLSEGIQGVMADPSVGILPVVDQKEHFDNAGKAAIDGLAFYGSMAVGGGIAGAPIKSAITRAVLTGAGSAATFPIIEQMPDFMRGDTTPGQYASGVATAAVFGGLIGGSLASFGPVSKYALQKADAVIEANPIMKSVKADITKYTRKTAGHVWDKFFTSGEEVLKKYGLGDTVEKLKLVRKMGGFTAARMISVFGGNTKDLGEQQKMIMGAVMDSVPFHLPQKPGVRVRTMNLIREKYGDYIGKFTDEEFNIVWTRAKKESGQLRKIGELMSKANVKVYDEASDNLHTFVLRDSYYPHRLVNDKFYRPGGKHYDEAVKKVMKKYEMYEHDAKVWVDEFADRIAEQNGDFVAGKTATLSSTYYLKGRNLDLPGFELNVEKVLPQYYEHAAKRLHTHIMFGPKEVMDAVRPIQQGMFPRDDWNALLKDRTTTIQPGLSSEMETITGQGMKKTKLPSKEPVGQEEIIKARIEKSKLENAKFNSTMRRYPGAYEELAKLPEGSEQQKLAESIIRHQLGAIEAPIWGEETLNRLSNLEVVTKLALGAIAQPSQIFSAVVRTQFRSSVKNLMRTFNDPDAADFALRSAVTLKSVVRQSEQSLGAKDTDFLSKVFFTQMDIKSRIFGALQGSSFAEHQASTLSKLVRKFPVVRDPETNLFSKTFGRPPKIQAQMQKIERKLTELGLDPVKIIKRGGYLTEEEHLMAANTVSMDVNFWGDSLSLPEFFRSPVGRYVTQFKSFGFQQSKLIKDHLIKPIIQHGDWGPFTRFVIAMPMAGEVIADAKALVRANYRRFTAGQSEGITRILENIANAAGFGLVYDAYEATKYGNSGSLGFIAGPIGTDTAKMMSAVGELSRGKPKKMAREMIEVGLPAATLMPTLRNIPGLTPAVAAAAPAISNLLLPKREAP